MTTTDDKNILKELGAGKSIDEVSERAGMSRDQFDAWWKDQIESRVPESSGAKRLSVKQPVEIWRDERGIPHIHSESDDDMFFGYGYAMAQDRLWQLDYLRRKAMGRLSEILGRDGVQQDVLSRTVGINRIAEREIKTTPTETLKALESFSNGINAVISESAGNLPIEFDLLDYVPEPWSPLDSIAIMGELRWYLTVRLPVIVIPELAKRNLNDDRLFEAFLTPEAGDESILPVGSYQLNGAGTERVGDVISDVSEGLGSNNWVVSGARAVNGSPMVASDPHIAFAAVSCWYEAHLSSKSYNVAGTGYVGVPAIMFGRNERVAWGLTNNICSQRDLYQEKTGPQHPGSFLFDGEWEPAKEIVENIKVKGEDSITKTIRFSRNGPIVDELLPEPAKDTGPVSLRWLGTTPGDEIGAMLRANRANSCDEFRESLRDWWVPTFSFSFADVDGHIGYQCVGRIPIRESWQRGYRHGWEPEHQWNELISYEAMPALSNPSRGWIRTANNRTAPEDFPYPLSGTWSSGHRAQRIREMIEEKDGLAKADFVNMQLDALSLRAVEATPSLLKILSLSGDEKNIRAASILEAWNCRMEPPEAGASIFELFFRNWSRRVSSERFSEDVAPLMSGAISGLALALLRNDEHKWFNNRVSLNKAVIEVFRQTIADLEKQLGRDMSGWTWSKVHTLTLRHTLSDRGELGKLLDRGNYPVRGSGVTVCNTGYDPNYLATMGANYRLIADISEEPAALWAVDAAGQSGHPGSPNYCGQLEEWLENRQHRILLSMDEVRATAKDKLVLESRKS